MSFKTLIPQKIKNLYHGLNAATFTIFNGYPAQKLKVIGVTGTDGKTTTATMIYHLLKTANFKVALISTICAYIGDEAIDTGFHVTSPDPRALQRLLRKMKKTGITHVVLEATSHGLDQHRLFGTNITYAVVTNVTHEHLDYHRDFNHYLKAKAKIFSHAKVAIINANDSGCLKLRSYIKSHTRVITYTPIKNSPFKEVYNQANAAGAAALAHELKIKQSLVNKGLASFPGVPGRMQSIPNHLGVRIVVDFAHTPNALKNALTELKPLKPQQLIAVFGCAGYRDATKRPLMGEIGARLADEVVLTSEDPRGENINLIMRQILDGIKENHGHVHVVINREEAIKFALSLAQKDDIVGVFGKGHERTQNIDGLVEIPWSDEQVVLNALKEL